MGRMESLLRNHKIYDIVRKKWVQTSPEEIVRQSWVHKMHAKLGYPLSLISLEKRIHEKGSACNVSELHRRFDLVCYSFQKDHIFPLLLMEFKADELSSGAFEQIIRYNHFIQAKFVALANKEKVITGVKGQNGYVFMDRLPNYQELKNASIF